MKSESRLCKNRKEYELYLATFNGEVPLSYNEGRDRDYEEPPALTWEYGARMLRQLRIKQKQDRPQNSIRSCHESDPN